MVKKSVKNKKQDDRKLLAFLAVFFTIIGFIVAYALKKQDKYIMFYAKQGLVLFIGQVIIAILSSIPIIRWFILGPILWICWAILWIITWINALSDIEKPTFIIGYLAKKISL